MPKKIAVKKKAGPKKVAASKSVSKKSGPKKASGKKTGAKKTGTKKVGTKKAKGTKGNAKATGLPKVRVQMFRQGLGDSFLITFDYQGANERHMLIDCGTLGNSVSEVKTATIAGHLADLLKQKKKKLDFLVATHEHQDHVSGFRKDLQPVLKDKVDQVWLAWTEDPKDQIAQQIAKYKDDLGAALHLASLAAPSSKHCKIAQSLLGFAGQSAPGLSFAQTVNNAMSFVREGTGGKTIYHKPGALITDQIPGFRVYVLGPPRSESALKDLGSHNSEELYGLAAALSNTAQFHTAGTPNDPAQPFDERYKQSGTELLQQQYPSYTETSEQWRRIDNDWLSGISELALQLDSLTNNTSLVLAFERIADGKVLLFPADAQQGNWLSWHGPKMKWSIESPSGQAHEITVADLLARTVFYKVGHHSSHNATAKGKGLEMMTSEDELVAFIPVDRAIALTRNPKDSWQMPARPLYRELLKRCQGRVVRADVGWAAPAAPGDKTEKEFLDMASESQWKKWKAAQNAATHISDKDELFIEYVLN